MLIKVLKDISRPQWMDIIQLLKKSEGMSVGELSRELGKSYMGIKQHCVSMEKKGYLETWRRPRPVGRPEKLYRLTGKIDPVFPSMGNELALEMLRIVGDVYGSSAPEKLIFNYFQNRAKHYQGKVKGRSVVEKATAFSKIRDQEGYLSRCGYDKASGFYMEEYHHPMESLGKAYPILLKAEERMVEQVLGARVVRRKVKVGGQNVNRFFISTL